MRPGANTPTADEVPGTWASAARTWRDSSGQSLCWCTHLVPSHVAKRLDHAIPCQ